MHWPFRSHSIAAHRLHRNYRVQRRTKQKIGHSHFAQKLFKCPIIIVQCSPLPRRAAAISKNRTINIFSKSIYASSVFHQCLSCIIIWLAMQKFIKTHFQKIHRSVHARKSMLHGPWMRLRCCRCCCSLENLREKLLFLLWAPTFYFFALHLSLAAGVASNAENNG